MSQHALWRFQALDSWFFREARPMESIGASELSSVFPPPVRTVAGAIRSAIGDFNGVDWPRYPTDYPELSAQIGCNICFATLRINALYLSRQDAAGNWQRLFPVPSNLVAIKKGRLDSVHRLRVGPALCCDLGDKVHMPVKDADIAKKKITQLGDYWLTASEFSNVLQGAVPAVDEFIAAESLFSFESRLGIAVNKQRGSVEEQMLYQTRHVRPQPQLSLAVELTGVDAAFLPKQGIVRLGGEGRGSAFEVIPGSSSSLPPHPLLPNDLQSIQGLMLVLLSPVVLQPEAPYAPLPGFTRACERGVTVWKATINGVALTLYCAVIASTQREGGWDLQERKPRPVQCLVPAGSVFYCTADNMELAEALPKLHGHQLDGGPEQVALGRGVLAAGLWHREDFLA